VENTVETAKPPFPGVTRTAEYGRKGLAASSCKIQIIKMLFRINAC
jgi:hypothetical protein